MKALIIAPRFPWPAHTGERLRATLWLSALSRTAEVTLVAPPGSVPDGAPQFYFVAARRSFRRGVEGVAAVIRNRLPFQCLLAAPYEWRGAIARARREAGPFDVTVVVLSRLDPWVRDSVEGPVVLDAVDSLRRSAEERWKAAAAPVRWLWRSEQERMARVETGAASRYGRIVVVNEDEGMEFGEAVTVANGIAARAPGSSARVFDFGFWGRLPYFANADAVSWLLEEIWPAIRSLRPDAKLVIGGAEASRSLRNAARKQGVTVVSPIDDVGAFARTIRVALMPVRYATGQSTKVLEAAEGGCAIVATPEALRGLKPLARFARVESTAAGFARAAVELLADDDRRQSAAEGLRDVIETDYALSLTLEKLSAIAAAEAS
jgi:hypothetical protein